jgi:hypothetical protein
MDVGAVSRYKLIRSQKLVTVQDLYWVQMRALPNVAERSWVSGYNGHYEFVLGAVTKAKTMTNNLPILSVLWLVIIFSIKVNDSVHGIFATFWVRIKLSKIHKLFGILSLSKL